MKATPLNMMINNELVPFDVRNRRHINVVINNLISDIDNILRFKIKNYFSNYYLIVAEKVGKDIAGPNWSEYLEYGTTDEITIELQYLGLPRHLSLLIKEEYKDYLIFEDDILVDINSKEIINNMDIEKFKDELEELKEILE